MNLKEIEGKHTVETLSEKLGITKQSTINLISKLKKQGYVKTIYGSNKKRIYTISTKKIIKKSDGMFDIINKYAKKKINPLFQHKVEGKYTVEDALIDSILTKDQRVIISALPLFNHINNWSKLYNLAKKHKVRNFTAALYLATKQSYKVKNIPRKYLNLMKQDNFKLKIEKRTDDYKEIEKEFKTIIPFSRKDLE